MQPVVSIKYDENMLVSTEDIHNIVNKLKCGKSSGPNGFSAESLKFSHFRLYYVLLSVAVSQYLSSKYNNQKVWTDVNALLFNQPKSVTTN